MSLHLSRLTGFMLLGFVAVMGANLMESLYISQVGTLELAALGYLSFSDDDARRNHGARRWRLVSRCPQDRCS